MILPIENVADLMLRPDVAETIQGGQFHVYPVATVDEGKEILTGVKAGERQAGGTFEKATVNYLVDKRMQELAEGMKKYEVPPSK